MKCTQCGKELRIVPEQVGMDTKNMPIYHRVGYCDACRLRCDLDNVGNVRKKKKDSVLSIIAAVFSLFTVTFFIGIIIGLIDVGINNKEYRHLGSWFAVIYGVIAGVVLFLI